ncbi:MAG: nitroreductase family protein [Gammaproteobacteria bacterium]|nr:nitroreductase family protein [Gammaproteobacteria bacterium]MBI5617403.1 nitroreductase family protein [Gammaproteobacteria bacterium]
MTTTPDVFELMHTMRAMRRLKPDPVPDGIIRKILDAAVCAPSGQNLQRWAFLVVTDDADKRFFGERYAWWMENRFAGEFAKIDPATAQGRVMRSARHLAQHMHEAPVLLFCCGRRDWPFAVAPEDRRGLAPPSYGSIYPAVQNVLLACRALGLGASLTTMHQMFEPELHAHFGIPESYGVVAVIPIGWPRGRFGPITREPAPRKTHFDRWGGRRPGLAEPEDAS